MRSILSGGRAVSLAMKSVALPANRFRRANAAGTLRRAAARVARPRGVVASQAGPGSTPEESAGKEV